MENNINFIPNEIDFVVIIHWWQVNIVILSITKNAIIAMEREVYCIFDVIEIRKY